MPLPNLNKEMRELENPPPEENIQMSVENVETVEEPVDNGLTEEEIFKKKKREKLLETLAKARVKSAEVRKQRKAEKEANKKPRGRPKKAIENVEQELDDGTTLKYPIEAEPQQIVEPPKPKVVEKIVQPQIDYDRIINGVHDKYLKSKAERKKNKQPTTTPLLYQHLPQHQPQFDARQFEEQIRTDERNKLKAQVEARKKEKEQEKLRQRTQAYYSKLAPMNMKDGTNWDKLFFS